MEVEFLEKINKIQLEIEPIIKDSKGFNYKYSSLDKIHESLKPLMKKHKLMVSYTYLHTSIQMNIIDIIDGSVSSSIIDFKDMLEKPHYTIKDGKETRTNMNYPQQVGALSTYFRRYMLVAFFDLLTEEDTDGVYNTQKKTTQRTYKANGKEYISAVTKNGKKYFKEVGENDYKNWIYEGNAEYDGLAIQIKRNISE